MKQIIFSTVFKEFLEHLKSLDCQKKEHEKRGYLPRTIKNFGANPIKHMSTDQENLNDSKRRRKKKIEQVEKKKQPQIATKIARKRENFTISN